MMSQENEIVIPDRGLLPPPMVVEVPVDRIVERVVEVEVEKRVEVPVDRIVEVEKRVEVPMPYPVHVEVQVSKAVMPTVRGRPIISGTGLRLLKWLFRDNEK